MDALACMKSLLLAASQYRTAKTPPNAALLQRSLEVRAAPALGPSSRGGRGAARPGMRGCPRCPPGLGARVALLGARPRRAPLRPHRRGAAGAWAGSAPSLPAGPRCRRPGRAPPPPPWLGGRRRGNPPGDRLPGELVAEGGRRAEEAFGFLAISPDYCYVLYYKSLWCLFPDVCSIFMCT